MTTAYEMMGGEQGVRALVTRFYELMDSLPEARACRAIHPTDLTGSAEKLFEYLTGWLGGPPIFVKKRGPPMLRRRHFHLASAGPEIDGWLLCFMRAWDDIVGDNPELAALVLPQIHQLARHMRNREDAVT